ncbi:UNVERIFIED_CONTAM: hypothetical protein Sangu_2977200, partial [Sesamum angustifolium]
MFAGSMELIINELLSNWRDLWGALRTLSAGISEEPWLVLGDFNAVIDDYEFCRRAADTSVSMAEFRSCILDTGLVQLPSTAWMETWPGASYICALPSTWDHSPLVFTGTHKDAEHAIFRFDNYLARQPGFLDLVTNIWRHHIFGTAMYEVVCKLKALKADFRRQRNLKGNLTENVKMAKRFLDKAQALFATYKEDILLHLVKCCRTFYSEAIKQEIRMLKQRAKLRWMKHGDQNSKVFFRMINSARAKQRVFQITKATGEHNLTVDEANLLDAPVTQSEIKDAFFDIDEDSGPGPDGYTSAFFKSAWPVIGHAISEAVGEFFRT